MPGAGAGRAPRPRSAARPGPAPPALPAAAWQGASAAEIGRGRAGPGRPSAPRPRCAPATAGGRGLYRAGPRVAVPMRSGGARRRAEQSSGAQPPAYPRGPNAQSGKRKRTPFAPHPERAASARPRPDTRAWGAERGGGDDWPQSFAPGRPGRGGVSRPAPASAPPFPYLAPALTGPGRRRLRGARGTRPERGALRRREQPR